MPCPRRRAYIRSGRRSNRSRPAGCGRANCNWLAARRSPRRRSRESTTRRLRQSRRPRPGRIHRRVRGRRRSAPCVRDPGVGSRADSANHAADRIAVPFGIRQSLEHHKPAALSGNEPGRGASNAGWAHRSQARLVCGRRRRSRDPVRAGAGGEHSVAVAGAEQIECRAECCQRRSAPGVDRERAPHQVKRFSHTRGERAARIARRLVLQCVIPLLK